MSSAPALFTYDPTDVGDLVAAILNHPEGMRREDGTFPEEALLFAVFTRNAIAAGSEHPGNFSSFTLRTVLETESRYVNAACRVDDPDTGELVQVAFAPTDAELQLSREVMAGMITDMGIDLADTSNVLTMAILITDNMYYDMARGYEDASIEAVHQLIDREEDSPLPAAPNVMIRFNNITPGAITPGHGMGEYHLDAPGQEWREMTNERYGLILGDTEPTGFTESNTDIRMVLHAGNRASRQSLLPAAYLSGKTPAPNTNQPILF